MKTDKPNDNDAALRKLLHEWRPAETLPPRFPERVWHRLARRETQPTTTLWSLLVERLMGALARPSLAVSYLTLFLLGGLVAGYWQARVDNAHASATLGARYVQMLDPYQMPRR